MTNNINLNNWVFIVAEDCYGRIRPMKCQIKGIQSSYNGRVLLLLWHTHLPNTHIWKYADECFDGVPDLLEDLKEDII